MIAVALLLGVTLLRQFAVAGPGWDRLDRLAIVPQWKFFGQGGIATDPNWFDDYHLLARSAATAEPGGWQELLWSDDCASGEWLWNPGRRWHEALIIELARLAMGGTRPQPTALAYLTVLRLCLDRFPLAEGDALQFAIVATRGRGERQITLRFVSEWHSA